MVGVKSSETINIMDTDAIFQSGGSCGFTASGSTTFTQRTVTVGKIKVNEALCPKDLEAKYLQKALPTGSMYDSVPFEQEFADKKAKTIAAQLETSIWQRRFWEHQVRDGRQGRAYGDRDFVNHLEYIHYNPVHHGLVNAPKDWQYSSFHR